jgi:flagellar hook-basal body complex protein FliE
MARKVFDRYKGNLTTTDGTITTIATIPVANNSNSVINVHATGRNTSNQDSFYKQLTALFKNVSGTVSQVESSIESKHVRDSGLSACVVSFEISSTNVLIRVTGVAATSIDWLCYVDTKEN